MYSLDDGIMAVGIARKAITAHVKGDSMPDVDVPEIFRQKSGTFVTIKTHPGHDLRGCIGYPEPVMPLIDAIIDGARSAATRDPRFDPLRPEELDSIVVEVSLLTPPELIRVKKPKHYLKEVVVGRDGLIVQRGPRKGLLLPQVPVENGWDVQTFLEHTCWKAHLTPDSWLDELTRIWRFSATVFAEREPHGEVEPVELSACD